MESSKTSGESYLHGDYTVETSSYHGGNNNITILSVFEYRVVGPYESSPSFETAGYSLKSYTDSRLGREITYSYTSPPYDRGSGVYQGGTYTYGPQNISDTNYFTQAATNNQTYGGEFVEITFPFQFVLKRLYMRAQITNLTRLLPAQLVVLGTNDKSTYDYIYTINSGETQTIDETFSNAGKYYTYKIVCVKTLNSRGTFFMEWLKWYGDIWA